MARFLYTLMQIPTASAASAAANTITKKSRDVPVQTGWSQVAIERQEVDVGAVQHQLDADENTDRVPLGHHGEQAGDEKHRATTR